MSEVGVYRKLPMTVEAMKIESVEDMKRAVVWASRAVPVVVEPKSGKPPYLTLYKTYRAYVGNWVAKVDSDPSEFYVFTDREFFETYASIPIKVLGTYGSNGP